MPFIKNFGIVLLLASTISSHYSGLYLASKNERYGGALMIAKSHMSSARDIVARATYPEDILFKLLWENSCTSIHTRDYLDFCVEHLSSYSNIIGASHDLDTQRVILEYVDGLLESKAHNLRDHMYNSTAPSIRASKLKNTLCVIIFSDKTANMQTLPSKIAKFHSNNRRNSFLATFYSAYRYFPNVVVYVASEREEKLLNDWNLPVFAVINMCETLNEVPKEKYFRNRPVEQLLPKYALLDVADRFENDATYAHFSYMYYTEGDQILHMRKSKMLFSAIDRSNNTVAIIPHRMQTIPLYQQLPEHIKKDWNFQKIEGVKVVIESSQVPRGSCCDNGHMLFPGCGSWWYFCPKWGLRQHTTWLQFGPSGLTMPLSTAHRGVCTYYAELRQCEIPPSCEYRSPSFRHIEDVQYKKNGISENYKKEVNIGNVAQLFCEEMEHKKFY